MFAGSTVSGGVEYFVTTSKDKGSGCAWWFESRGEVEGDVAEVEGAETGAEAIVGEAEEDDE